MMRAITLHRPWAGAVAHLGKPVENRSWPPPQGSVGDLLAIHAGQKWDPRAAEWIVSKGLATPDQVQVDVHPTGVVAVARLIGFGRVGGRNRRFVWMISPADWRDARLSSIKEALRSYRWVSGPYCWFFDEIVALREPVPCRGRQGLWRLPLDVAYYVWAQCEELRAERAVS